MKTYQKLELLGAALAFAALFLEVFVFSLLYRDVERGDEAVLEIRLNHIYHAVTGTPYGSPKWEDVEEFVKGPKRSLDNHLRSEEVHDFARVTTSIAFATGALMTLVAKYQKFRQENKTAEPGATDNLGGA